MVRNLPAKAGDARGAGSIPGLRRSPEEKLATHSSILAWKIPCTEEAGATVHGVAKSRTRLRDWAHSKDLFCGTESSTQYSAMA